MKISKPFLYFINKTRKLVLMMIVLAFTTANTFAQKDTIFRYFSATQVEKGVLINFTIIGGITCSGVKIERSLNQQDYEVIHEFLGVCGGVSVDESYSFTDTNPHPNVESHYRLDLGSLGIYSDVLAIRYIEYSESGVTFFPNPCAENCAIYFSNTSRLVHNAYLYDRYGKLILSESTTDNKWIINRQNHSTGIYFYRLFRDGEERLSGKIIFP